MRFSFDFFDKGLDRMGTDCEKWDMARAEHGDILPYWVADMDFECAPAITRALQKRAAHPSYGYTGIIPDDSQALCAFWARRHQVVFAPEDVLMLPTVVTGLALCAQAFSPAGDGVVIQPPVYGPFFSVLRANNRTALLNPLIRDADGRWRMDLGHLETLFINGARLMFLCSPHNPISRLWTEAEIKGLTALCARYDVTLISDEIHADFTFDGRRFFSVLDTGYDKTAVLVSASKTFNVAGLLQASLVTRGARLRETLEGLAERNGVRSGNIFALTATRAAYAQGDDWLDGLKAYLEAGRGILLKALQADMPLCRVAPVEATYLALLDLTAYGFTTEEWMQKTVRAGALFTEGTFFSDTLANGWLRFNFACPHRLILEGVRRLKIAAEG